MFLMWGYEGEELEDIAATVEHVKVTNPDIFFTTVSYPIKGTGYFDKVRDRVPSPIAWAEGSDRDYVIAGRRGKRLLQARRPVAAQRGRGHAPAVLRPGALRRIVGRRAPRQRRVARLERGVSAALHDLPRFGVIAAALRAPPNTWRTSSRIPAHRRPTGIRSNGTWRARCRRCRASRYCSRIACGGGARNPGRTSSRRSAAWRCNATRASPA